MTTQRWTERFYETTRGRIVRMLRRSERTVGDLAEALDLTGNAVRGHLSVLERDGWIERSGVRRGLGKPAQLYRLTDEAGRAFSRAYAPVLTTLFSVLEERLGPSEFDEMLDEVGRRAAAGVTAGVDPADFDARLTAAVELIRNLGGDVDVEGGDDGIRIVGHGCPLSALTGRHENACRIVQTLLADITGRPVREVCERGEFARCAFEVGVARGAA